MGQPLTFCVLNAYSLIFFFLSICVRSLCHRL